MYGNASGLNVARGVIGPWPCQKCGEVTQCADIGKHTNYIFCRNANCDYERIVDKKHNIIKEDDGTFWKFDAEGHKTRIRAQ